MLLRSEQRDWDDLGLLDPEWMMLTDPAVDPRDLDLFFATGRRQVTRVMEIAAQLGVPTGHVPRSISGVVSEGSPEPFLSTSTSLVESTSALAL